MGKVQTLIELFCAETLKNVVPALALQPERLVMLVHTGTQYSDVYEHTVRALRDRASCAQRNADRFSGPRA